MGLLADIYISTDGNAVKYDTSPKDFPDRAERKGLTALELSTLWSILQGIEWDVDSMDEFACLLELDRGERLIHRLPATMVADLAKLTPDRIAAAAPQWTVTEELGWKPDEARLAIEDLARLARQAIERG